MSRPPGLVAADALTWFRLMTAVGLVAATWTRRLGLAAVLVSLAWVTDLLDGKLARAAGGEGRLGRWDLTVDTLVGVGCLIGLTGAGEVPIPAAIAALLVFGGLSLRGNVAAAMLLQLSGFVPLLLLLWERRPGAWWLPAATAVLIGVIDWRRLVRVNVPTFIAGLTTIRRSMDSQEG